MIPVAMQREPADFDAKVRRPGHAFLRMNPNPTAQQFKKADYWRLALPQLKASYRDVCAYSAVWIPTEGTVDHFLPKYSHRTLAYEWRNYRLALDRINNYKDQSVVVLDPFTVQLGWFVLDFSSLWVRPNSSHPEHLRQRVQRSIDILKLNDDDQLVNLRFEVYQGYLDGKLNLDDLDAKYPFIASEIRRQGIRTRAEEPS